MSTSSTRRALLPLLLSRFARRFDAAEWTGSGRVTPLAVWPTSARAEDDQGAAASTQLGRDRRHCHQRASPPTPTLLGGTMPAFALQPLLPNLARRAYSAAQDGRGDNAAAASDGGGESSAPPPPTAVATSATAAQPIPLHCHLLPPTLVPYAELMRLDKPVGSWLLAWPGLWSIALLSPSPEEMLRLSLLFAGGSVLLRGAGCTVNDLWDRDIDRRVSRTRDRPLASGAVSVPSALTFLAAQLLVGLAVLSQLNVGAQALGGGSLLLVGLYPLMKRWTWWPQLFLGLTINWGALMGAVAASPEALAMEQEQEREEGGAPPPGVRLTREAAAAMWRDPAAWLGDAWVGAGASLSAAAGAATGAWLPPLALYGSGVAWTLVYDTIYAHQDIRDDEKVGVKSTARLFADRGVSKCALASFAAAQQALLAGAGVAAGLGPAYFAGAACAGLHVAWQVSAVDLSNGSDCARKFASNKWTGALVWAGIVADRAMAVLLAGGGV